MTIRKFNNIQFCPYIPTEETIFKNMEKETHLISDEYELFCLPLAHLINTIGIKQTNSIINSTKSDKIRVFVCQHIYVNKLVFDKTDIVFTPHSSVKDSFISIPHYTVSVDKNKIMKEKKIKFSFIGSTSTHWTRKKIVETFENCYDSGKHWGLETKDLSFKNRYIEMMGNSEFSLCPRGTGISSIRLFESVAMESFPVIISDGYEPPLKDIINWERISIHIKESDIGKIPELLEIENLDNNYLKEIYNNYLCNENLHKTLIKKLHKE